MRLRTTWLTALLLGLLVTAGCAVNPVTGERELWLMTTEAEIARGEKHYLPLQQMGGGLYTVDSALTKYVAGVGQRVAAVSDRPLPYEFVVLNSSSPNAWALPGGKIAITRGLLVELENEAELAAVLGHEVVHSAARHGAQAQQRGLLSQLLLLGVAIAGKDLSYLNYIIGAGNIGLLLANRTYGRDAEREADYYGIKYMHAAGYDTTAAVTLQEKFVALSKGRQANWLEGLFASHPPSTERVENNRKALAEFPAVKTLGRVAYQERIAYLRARKEAYKEADRARRLIRQSPATAGQAIDSAISQEPEEPGFYGIKGQILERRGQYEEAVRTYSAAIERDGGYYKYYLDRGLAYDSLGQREQARRDLERSNSLLPTAVASYALGNIVLADGERAEAKRLYRAASTGGGDIGDDARRAYIKLDIADAPDRYVTTETFIENGRVIVKIENTTSYRLRDVAVRIDITINGKRVRPRLQEIARLEDHDFRIVRTGVPYRENDTLEINVRILRAKPAS